MYICCVSSETIGYFMFAVYECILATESTDVLVSIKSANVVQLVRTDKCTSVIENVILFELHKDKTSELYMYESEKTHVKII